MRLLPLPGLALRVPVSVGAVLEDDGDRVQTTEVRRVAVVVRRSAITDRPSLEELAHSRGLEAGLLATLAHHQALRLAVEATVWPDSRAVGDVVPGFDPEVPPGALHRDLHLGAAVDRDHAAHHHLSSLFTDLFAQHCPLLSVSIRSRQTGCRERVFKCAADDFSYSRAPRNGGSLARARTAMTALPGCRRLRLYTPTRQSDKRRSPSTEARRDGRAGPSNLSREVGGLS